MSTEIARLKERTASPKGRSFPHPAKKEALKASLSAEAWTSFEKLLELLHLQSYQEGKLLYTQGAMDCIHLCQFMQTDYITSGYLE